MQRVLDKLFFVSVDDANLARSMRLAMILALVMTLITIVFIPVTLVSPQPMAGLIALAVGFVVFLGAYFLARSGRVALAMTLLIGIISLIILGSIFAQGNPIAGMFLGLGVVIASLTLRPLHVWMVVVINIVGLLLVQPGALNDLFNTSLQSQMTVDSILLLFLIGVIGALGARELQAAVASLQHARHAADRANADLALANTSLETRVAERTAELDTALVSQRALNSDLHDSLAAQQQLNQIIADLSLPIIPVRADTIIVPLTGAIDSARADQLISNVLTRLETGQVQLVILDVTGVPIVDTQVAQALIRTAEAAKLMGTRTMLVGIRPEVAQTLVGLGINLGELHTAATLQNGLEQAQRAAASNGKAVRRPVQT